jgi:predicted cobalt transporter CbtA
MSESDQKGVAESEEPAAKPESAEAKVEPEAKSEPTAEEPAAEPEVEAKPEPAAEGDDKPPEPAAQPELEPESVEEEEEEPDDGVPRVLVTGASGYIATLLTKTLLEDGRFRIRGSVRNKKKKEKVCLAEF